MVPAPLRQPVYDDMERRDARPRLHLETSFQFLNRVAGTYWQQVRDLVQAWADHLPDEGSYRDIRGRLRADDHETYSAFLELYLHETLLRAGYDVEIHPRVPTSERQPDFLVSRAGLEFYVEAKMPGARPEARAAANRRSTFLDTINRGRNRDFYLSLDHLTVGPRPVQGAIARRAVDAWLTGLSPDTDLNDRESRERFRWANDGWEVEFSAIPIPREHRGRPDHRPIGIYADGEAGVIDDAPSIRSALDSKASAYGALDRPLILAAGTFIWDHDKQHSSNATFGHLAVQAWEDEGGVRHRQSIRRPDGFFGAPPDWSHRDVSAVLHVNQLQPSHFQGAEVTLWHHPAATLPLPIDIGIPAQIMRLDGTEMWEVDSAVEAVEHFEVPAVWPVGDAFPDRVDGTSGSEER